jgi:adenine-specific DNA-methyltransferase
MNYIGSKRKLVPFIKEQITKSIKIPLKEATFCDLFAGTGIVGRSFKSDVRTVLSNDIEYYSFILNANYIQNNHSINNQTKLIESLNNLPPIKDGFIYNNYCLGSGSQREYFSDLNGQKIDTIREHIKQLKKDQKIDTVSYYFLLASLIESADKVANTASVYGAHLKHLKKTAQKELIVQPALFEIAGENHQVFQEDSNALVRKIKGDILYIDPPYNHRQYGANYHLLNTIALYDHFIPKGKSGLREYTKSAYCKKKRSHRLF